MSEEVSLGEVMNEVLYTLPLLCRVVEDGYGRNWKFSWLIAPIVGKGLGGAGAGAERCAGTEGEEEGLRVGKASLMELKKRGFLRAWACEEGGGSEGVAGAGED